MARANRLVNRRPRRRAAGADTMSVRWAKLVTLTVVQVTREKVAQSPV